MHELHAPGGRSEFVARHGRPASSGRLNDLAWSQCQGLISGAASRGRPTMPAGRVDALETEDDALTLGISFEERVKLAVDYAHATFTLSKVEGMIRRSRLRYPNTDLRRLVPIE